MRLLSSLRRAGLVVVALLVFPAAAAAADFTLTIPAPAGGSPRVFETGARTGEGGASIVVWSTDSVCEGLGPLTVDTMFAGPGRARRRWTAERSTLADVARDSAGDLDLLTMAGSATPGTFEARLVLYRAVQNGRVRRVWSGGRSWKAAVARRGRRLAIAWLQTIGGHGSSPGRVVLRLVTSPDGRRFSAAHTIGHVLPSWLSGDQPGFVNDLALALDAGGRPVVALTASRRAAPALVLATLTTRGRVRSRQLARGVDGLVDAQATRSGRVAVIVEDTGIEGEVGECVSDHKPRRIWGTIRDAHATRFGAVVMLHTGPYTCEDSPAQLVTGSSSVPAVVWGSAAGAPQTPPSVMLALALPGGPFAPAVTIASGALFRTATWREGGGILSVVTTRPTDPHNLYGGPLVHQGVTAGSGVSPAEPFDPAGAETVISATTDSDVAWQRPGSRDLQLTGFGGQ
jgi:hypothetical protein